MGIFINVSFTSLSPILPHPRCPSLHSLRWSLDFMAALSYWVSSLCPVSTLPFLLLFLSKYLVRLRVYFCIFSASGHGLVTQHLWKYLLRGHRRTSIIRISVTVLPTATPSRCSWGQKRSRSLQVSAAGSSSLEHSSAHSLDMLVSWYGLLADNSCIPLLFLACWSHSTSILLHFSWKQLPKSPFIIHSTTPI